MPYRLPAWVLHDGHSGAFVRGPACGETLAPVPAGGVADTELKVFGSGSFLN